MNQLAAARLQRLHAPAPRGGSALARSSSKLFARSLNTARTRGLLRSSTWVTSQSGMRVSGCPDSKRTSPGSRSATKVGNMAIPASTTWGIQLAASHAIGDPQETLARRGQREPARAAQKQRHRELALELRQTPAQRGLTHAERARRLGEAAVPAELEKAVQRRPVHERQRYCMAAICAMLFRAARLRVSVT